MKRNFILTVVTVSMFLVTIGMMILGTSGVLAEDERQIHTTMSGNVRMNAIDIVPFNWK